MKNLIYRHELAFSVAFALALVYATPFFLLFLHGVLFP